MSTNNKDELLNVKKELSFEARNYFHKYTLNKFTLFKTVYAKKRKKFDMKMLNKILALEINQHLLAHPDVEFDKVEEKPKQNDDLSVTYEIHFKNKSVL